MVRVDIPDEVHKAVKLYAVKHDITVKEAYKRLVLKGLKKNA